MTAEPATTPQQLARIVANALWPHLKRNGWNHYRTSRAWSFTGNPRTATHSTAHAVNPNPLLPATETLSVEADIRTYSWPEDNPHRITVAIKLTLDQHDLALATLDAATIADYETALETATCRQPFTAEKNEHGDRILVRNRHDGTISHRTARALEALALASDHEVLPVHVAEALLTDTDISLEKVRAAIEAGARP